MFDNFNRKYTILTPELLEGILTPSRLSLGARVLSNHILRSTKDFCGSVLGISKDKLNEKAFKNWKR